MRKKQGFLSHTRRRKRRFGACVSPANHDNIEIFSKHHINCGVAASVKLRKSILRQKGRLCKSRALSVSQELSQAKERRLGGKVGTIFWHVGRNVSRETLRATLFTTTDG